LIRQTVAIFVDAYRDLNSRKLFWITLILSALFIGAFALVGVDERGLQIVRTHVDMPVPQAEYIFKYYLFRVVIIGLWLTWVATILALISTAGIFPDLITGGSIDLYLSKPLSRGRLFFTKYLAGLTFVALQVIVVTTGGFLIMGWRGHEWLPQLFLAIPIVVCFFSYLFAICVFFGVLTRSTIAALLLTIGAWTFLAAVDWAEPALLTWHDIWLHQADRFDADARETSAAPESPTTQSDQAPSFIAPTLAERAQSARDIAWRFELAQRITYDFKTVTPKTTDTIDLLNRYVFTDEEVESSFNRPGRPREAARRQNAPVDQQAAAEGAQSSAKEVRSRSIAWVVGTSLLFELLLVTWAGWIFCRRDY
jgi:hypothetical protein